MDLVKRFEEAIAHATVYISTLEINRLYPIVGAKRMTTKYGSTILLSIWESEANIVQTFLPKIYCVVISDDDDVEKINTKIVLLNLVFKGLFETSKSYLLRIES